MRHIKTAIINLVPSLIDYTKFTYAHIITPEVMNIHSIHRQAVRSYNSKVKQRHFSSEFFSIVHSDPNTGNS